LAYPDEISYIWPFRYDAGRIEPVLREELSDPHSRRGLAGKPVLVAARFHTADASMLLLPLRWARIIYLEISAGLYSFTFRLGPAYQFQDAADLASRTIQTAMDVEHLAFRAGDLPCSPLALDAEALSVSWKAFAKLLVAESNLPINAEAKRSLYFHIMAPTAAGAKTRVTRIRRLPSAEDVYGFRLRQGRQYQIKYAHYVPMLEGQDTTIREIMVEPKLASQNIEVNTAEATLIGNYGLDSFFLAAVTPTPMSQIFAIAPKEKMLASQAGAIQINTHRIELPVAVKWSLRWWLLRTFFPGLVLFLALTLIGIANLIEKNFPKLVDGSLKWSDIGSNWYLIVIVLFGSLLASFAVPILQSRSKSK
jgi:hypothetical protein